MADEGSGGLGVEIRRSGGVLSVRAEFMSSKLGGFLRELRGAGCGGETRGLRILLEVD